jgi:hypothetical protein
MVKRLRYYSVLVFLSLGCGSQADSHKKPEAPEGQAEEPAVTKDGRWIISLSPRGLTIKGTRVQIGKASKGDLEKILGPTDRVVDVPDFGTRMVFWDKKGIRIYPRKHNDVVDYLDCMFVVEPGQEYDPKSTFHDAFLVEGIEISKTTTKDTLQGRIKGKLVDHSLNLPGFSVDYSTHSISFEMSKDKKVLQSVRISDRLGR